MQKQSWKITFLHTLVFVALALLTMGGLGIFFMFAYDDQSVYFFMPRVACVFWPGFMIPRWETSGPWVLFVGFAITLFLYSGVITLVIEGIIRFRRK